MTSFGLPLLTWTVRTEADKAQRAAFRRRHDLRRNRSLKPMGDIEQRQQGEEDGAVVRVVSRIAAVPAAEWDACARGADSSGKHAPGQPVHLPCLSPRSGRERIGDARRPAGCRSISFSRTPQAALLACMPCYLKSHSYGEYVFDHAWADAYERAGGSYYPKLQASVPFTPVTGPRLLVREGPGRTEREALLLQAAATLTERLDASSLHITFPTREEWELAGKLGFLQRNDQQFHWRNEGYASFEDFLGALASRKRKAIRGERKRATRGRHRDRMGDRRRPHRGPLGRVLRLLHGHRLAQMGLALSDAELLQPDRRDHARRDPARACQARRPHHRRRAELHRRRRALRPLLGRRSRSTPACISRSATTRPSTSPLRKSSARVEAGAQGAHKLARGYLPVPTYSAHWIRDPGLRRAVADYLKRERAPSPARSRSSARSRPTGSSRFVGWRKAKRATKHIPRGQRRCRCPR